MPAYRLYLMDPHSGHIDAVEEMHAADDVGAVHEVQHRAFPVPVELWQGGRKVTRVDALPEAAAYSPAPLELNGCAPPHGKARRLT